MSRAGRYAPSPTGDFHLGNLRTALIAWALARQESRPFLMRMEDLDDRAYPEAVERQLEDLAEIGIDWDGDILYQSARADAYDDVVADLQSRNLLYECYCTRSDIRNAPSAPHQPPGSYPGTCRDLTEAEREAGRAKLEPMNRGPALRMRSTGETVTVTDRLCGETSAAVDDLVIKRGDGVLAYNLVAVVDDAYQGVGQVVRADDLLSSTPRQVYLQQLLGYDRPEYVHVPLAVGSTGIRLAKRDGAVTLRELHGLGWTTPQIVRLMTESLGVPADSASEFLERFRLDDMPRDPWYVPLDQLAAGP